jgi:uncharacterized delta-60 repeat protein
MFKSHLAALFTLSILLIASINAVAQAGQLDPAFGKGGIVTTDFGNQINSNIATANAVTIQTDGKILVAGGIPSSSGFPVAAVARYNTDGSLDASFGTSGFAITKSINALTAIALQTDGKIVVSAPAGVELNVARYTTTGQLDTSFGTNGIFNSGLNLNFDENSNALVIQPDGKILVANGILLRLLSSGQIDSSFGVNGTANVVGNSASQVTVLSGGKILVAAANGLVSRYTPSGNLDTSFGVHGQLPSASPANALVLLGNGEFLAGSSLTSSITSPTSPTTGFAVFRYLGSGISDGTFGTHGGVVTAIPKFSTVSASALAIQSSGDIVAFGSASLNFGSPVFALARYSPAGKLDPTFGTNGTVTTAFGTTTLNPSSIAIQSDGNIVAVGGFTTTELHGEFDTGFKLARYLGQ